MTFSKYQSKMAACVMAEGFDAAQSVRSPEKLCWALQFHWDMALCVMECESEEEIRELVGHAGWRHLATLHMDNIHFVFEH